MQEDPLLPRPLWKVDDSDHDWMFRLHGSSQMLSIEKPLKILEPAKDEIFGFKRRSGDLTYIPQFNGMSTIPFGNWSLSYRHIPHKGNMLVVTTIPSWRTQSIIDFAFQTKHDPRVPSVRRWITRIRKDLRPMVEAARTKGIKLKLEP